MRAKCRWFLLLWLCLAGGMASCAPVEPPSLGLHISALLSQQQLLAIRSFRVMAFVQDIYTCNPTTNRVQYSQVGYTTLATFDWTFRDAKTPSVRLFLPDEAVGQQWVIQVEAFQVSRSAQSTNRPLAQGCVGNIQPLTKAPTIANIQLDPS